MVMNVRFLFTLLRKAVISWIDDFGPSMGAAISYYTIFSLAPLLVIVIAVAGALFGQEAVRGEIVDQLQGLIGREGAIAVQGMIRSASEPSKGLVAGAISVGVLIVGATTVFAELQSALDRIWHVPEKAKPTGLWALLRARVLSFGLILGLAFLLMVSLLVSTGVAAFGQWAGGLLPGWELMLQGINILLSIATTTVLFGMIFKFMPTVNIAWGDVWVGAGVTAILFEVGKAGIGLYLGKSGVSDSFAAAGSLVVLVAWVYYAAQIFLLGAEFTKVYSDSHGSDAGIRAVAATEAMKHAAKAGGVFSPAEVRSGAGGEDEAETARTLTVQRELDKRPTSAISRVAKQALVLGIATVASAVLHHFQKRHRAQRRVCRKAP